MWCTSWAVLKIKQSANFLIMRAKLRQLRTRINERRSAINRKVPGYLDDHFAKGHGKTPVAYLTVVGIERVLPLGDEELLTTIESLWINNYDSIQFGATLEDKLPFIANSNLFLKQKESSLFKKHERIHTELFSCTPCDKEFKGQKHS